MTAPLPTRIPGDPAKRRLDRLLLVTDPDGEQVPVRWCIADGAPLWKCKRCGPQRTTACCSHTHAAALVLARTLLGLVIPIEEGATQ
jgi:hypothetical protein